MSEICSENVSEKNKDVRGQVGGIFFGDRLEGVSKSSKKTKPHLSFFISGPLSEHLWKKLRKAEVSKEFSGCLMRRRTREHANSWRGRLEGHDYEKKISIRPPRDMAGGIPPKGTRRVSQSPPKGTRRSP